MSNLTADPYHPDPEIDAGIRADMLISERIDLAAGYPPRWFLCPQCGATHRRGWFMSQGMHRCLGCGYVCAGGTTHTSRPPPA